MKRCLVILISMFFLIAAGQAFAKDYEITKKSDDLTVQIKIDKNPPVIGSNKMEIGIKTDKGNDVTDARVSVDYGMPAMPGMGPMNYKTDALLKGNYYIASINFSMTGPWFVNIKITRSMTLRTFSPKRTTTMPPTTSPLPSSSASPRRISGPN